MAFGEALATWMGLELQRSSEYASKMPKVAGLLGKTLNLP